MLPPDAAEANLLSGNAGRGLELHDAGTSGNLIAGNFVGTDASGTVAVPNSQAGIIVYNPPLPPERVIDETYSRVAAAHLGPYRPRQ